MTDAERAAETARVYRGRLGLDDETRLLWADLAAACHVGTTTHVAGDPHASAFREGQRATFLYLAGRAGLPLTGG